MIGKALALIVLVIAPAALAVWLGQEVYARYLMIGVLLALKLSLLARSIAGFSLLIPVVYAAAAITAQATDGVAALIVAMAAAAGVASSQGLHRGLIALLAAALIGSFDPAVPADVLRRALAVAAGSAYGYLLATTVLRHVTVENRSVHSQTALSYAVLLSVLVLIAWITARYMGFEHGWWLPLAVAAVSEPSLDETQRRAMLRLAGTLLGTLAIIGIGSRLGGTVYQLALAVGLLLLLFTAGRTRPWLRSLLAAPVIVLLTGRGQVEPVGMEYIEATLIASALVVGTTLLGEWVLWTLRPDSGRVSTA
jgi:hypothetical protein